MRFIRTVVIDSNCVRRCVCCFFSVSFSFILHFTSFQFSELMKGAMTRACLTIYKILHSTLPLLLFYFIVVFLFCYSQILCFLNVSVSFAWVQFGFQAVCVERHLGCKYSRLQYVIVVGGIDSVFFFSLSKKAFRVMSSCSNHTNNKHKQLNTNNIAFIIDGIPLPLMLRVCVCVSLWERVFLSYTIYTDRSTLFGKRTNGEHTTELLSIFRRTVTVTVNSIRYQFNRIND